MQNLFNFFFGFSCVFVYNKCKMTTTPYDISNEAEITVKDLPLIFKVNKLFLTCKIYFTKG